MNDDVDGIKTLIGLLCQDNKYWEKREKNNNAARRSREARRLKENQIVLRAAYLEKENRVLKQVNIMNPHELG